MNFQTLFESLNDVPLFSKNWCSTQVTAKNLKILSKKTGYNIVISPESQIIPQL